MAAAIQTQTELQEMLSVEAAKAPPPPATSLALPQTGAAIVVKYEPSVDRDLNYYAWLENQAVALRTRQRASLDWDKLAEELEAMAASERREGKKQLKNLLAHLLKWSFQSDELSRRAHSWRRTVREAREELNDLLEDSPGLITPLKDAFAKVYDRARNMAADDTGLPLDRFPTVCPWNFDQVIVEDFWPQPASSSHTDS
jgi:hypothetical protein